MSGSPEPRPVAISGQRPKQRSSKGSGGAGRRRRTLLRRPGQIWGLRLAVVGLILLAAAVIGGIVLIAGDDSSEPVDGADQTPAERVQEIADRTLTEDLEQEEAGLSLSHPDEWTASDDKGIVNLESPSHCTVISLSAPAETKLAGRLQADSIAGIRRNFGKALVRPGRKQQLGNVPTTGAILVVRNQAGTPVVIRLAVSRGRELAHLTEVVLRKPPCREDEAETGLILGSIEFSK